MPYSSMLSEIIPNSYQDVFRGNDDLMSVLSTICRPNLRLLKSDEDSTAYWELVTIQTELWGQWNAMSLDLQ